MKLIHLFAICCLGHAGWSHADIYKRVDSNGHVTYSSEPIKGGKKLYLKPLATVPGSRSSQRGTPEDFPKVDNQTQKRRDLNRRIILEDELATEENSLVTARESLAKLEKSPEPLVGPDGAPNPENAKYSAKLKAAQDLVNSHEQNIKDLRTEISNLK